MLKQIISEESIEEYKKYLCEEEKSKNTIDKYMRDVKAFMHACEDKEVIKETVIEYKQKLISDGYAVRSINSMLASINSFFSFLGRNDLCVKSLKVQQQIFCREEKKLTKTDYERLCLAANRKHNERLFLILQTICSTGIRISELSFITVENVYRGEAIVSLKGKTRNIFIVRKLQKKLKQYIVARDIKSGPVFITRNGRPLDRTNIWREMKKLSIEANVNPEKVFPHNLRHLFARVFYGIEKDIAKLADILGHSSINTTRIYVISTGSEHRKGMERMRLVI